MTTNPQFMVIDDDPLNNLICKFLIKGVMREARIEIFTEPETALVYIKKEYRMAPKGKTTILLLDINLPIMTGWEFLDVFQGFSEEIKQQFAIYLVSSSIEIQDEEKANLHPLVCGFIPKPLKAEKLKQILSLAHKQ